MGHVVEKLGIFCGKYMEDAKVCYYKYEVFIRFFASKLRIMDLSNLTLDIPEVSVFYGWLVTHD